MAGLNCAWPVVQRGTPSLVHINAPAALTRRAKISPLPLRKSVQATIAPPKPSVVITAVFCGAVAVTSAIPFAVQREVPDESTC